VVFAAADEGDATARAIVDRLGDEVVAMAGAAIRRLRLSRLEFEVVLGGGLFLGSDPRLVERVRGGIGSEAPRARVVRIADPPLVGAVLMGLDAIGATGPARTRAREGLTHARLAAGRAFDGWPSLDGDRADDEGPGRER
jgi:hypothetical protein